MNISGREYENLVREGIRSAKAKHIGTARRLLERAAVQNPNDTRVWLWLSATTNDPGEQRSYLERAIAADPYNTAAQNGLAILNENPGEPVPNLPQAAEAEVKPPAPPEEPPEPVLATTRTFECPNCGGRQQFDIHASSLACEYCGCVTEVGGQPAADSADIPIQPALRTAGGHRWAASVHEVVCEKCGAHSVEVHGVKTRQCAYCGSNQLVDSDPLKELLDPQVIALFRLKEEEALARARGWLNRGIFAPDNLVRAATHLALRPAYYPFWTFDGGVEIHWNAEEREHYGRSSYQQPEWRAVSGIVNEFFDDVLVPGVSALDPGDVSGLEPFDLKGAIVFEPDHLAGWPTLAYDRSLADASLLARAQVLRRLRPLVRSRVESGREIRAIRIGAGGWSGLTYKHVLLPIWVGTYRYDGEEFRVLVNGQTGRVGGTKPQDRFKVTGFWIFGLIGVALLIALLTWLIRAAGWF